MNLTQILLLGVEGTGVAFQMETGQQLGSRQLEGRLGEGLVSVLAEAKRVFAHTHGEMFCLDIFTGEGLGYGIASLAIQVSRMPPPLRRQPSRRNGGTTALRLPRPPLTPNRSSLAPLS